MRALVQRIVWFATGRTARPVVAFDWIRGRVGSRENPDGMRSLIHAGLALTAGCALLDLWLLERHDWSGWAVFAFLHTGWVFSFVLVCVLNVGFLETPEGVRLTRLGGPNVLTLSRSFLLPPLLYVIAQGDYFWAAFFYGVTALTDVADGWWARHGGGQSKLGIVLDPVVDLSFHLGVFVTISLVGLLDEIALVLVLLRSGLLVFGTGLLYLWKGQVRIQPTPLGKGTGLLMSVGTFALLALAEAAAQGVPLAARWVSILQVSLVALLTLAVVHVVAIGLVNLRFPPAVDARWPGRRLPRGSSWPDAPPPDEDRAP